MAIKRDTQYTFRMNSKVIAFIDQLCASSLETRSTWIFKAILDKLKSLGYPIEDLFKDDQNPLT
jgi:Leu/Phe-tRNA-protein transferase